MVEITELLVNLKNFALNYFYTKVEDEALFRDYMKNFYYYNGVVGLDTKNTYPYATRYDGELFVDPNKDIFFNEGGLSADEDEGVVIGNGSLTIP